MKLSEGNINKEYIITEINTDISTKIRLQVLGLLSGTKIRILSRRMNGSMIVRSRGTRLGIDKDIVQRLEVRK